MIKICQECGAKFETNNGNQKFCNQPHFRICKVCGNKYEVSRYHLTAKDSKVTCSKKCASELRKRTNNKKYGGNAPASSKSIQQKMMNTMLTRYGVEHAAQSSEILDKMKSTNLAKYGHEFYAQSDKGKQDVISSWKDPSIRDSRISKKENTNLIKYGSKSSLSNENVRNKIRKTYQMRTGFSEPFSNPDVQKKSIQTNLHNLGVAKPLQDKNIKEKWIQTNLEKYGVENPMQNINIQKKAQATCLKRYGNTCFLQSDLGIKLTESSMITKYDRRWYSKTSDWKISRMLDPTKIEELMLFYENPQDYIIKHYDEKPNIRILSNDLGVHENTIGQIILNNNLQDLVSYTYSHMEDEVYNFILSIDSDIKIERNTHKIITPLELDLYLPEYRIGIECNPTSTHNSSINTFDRCTLPTKYDYHMMKTNKCESKNIFLFHIFGSEWTYCKPIIQSMIRNLLGKCSRKIYARKCKVLEIDGNMCKDFLNANHRQGNVNSSIRLGLFLENELVSVMTFGKMRSTIGTDKTDLTDCWELVRFCSLLNTSVVGGASKLFTYFVNTYKPVRIRSFSDRSHTKGNLYSTLKFTKVRSSDPGYVWVDTRTDISYHRYCAQKQNIQKFLHDDTIDLTKTEKQIMEEHGFVQVFDSGTILWEWRKD